MAQKKRSPGPSAVGAGAKEAGQNTCVGNSTAWNNWARKANTGRLSAHQRRAVRLMAASPQVTPEIALRAARWRHG